MNPSLAAHRLLYYYRRKLSHQIDRDAIVLDIGSGNNPHPRANVICEKYFEDSTERGGVFVTLARQVVVGADAMRLPFRDKAFDYVIASHILEHMDDPVSFAAELQRVGKAGYIETPTVLCESLTPFKFHLWYVWSSGNKILMKSKTKPIEFQALAEQGRTFIKDVRITKHWWSDHFFMRFFWKDGFELEVIMVESGKVQSNEFVRAALNDHSDGNSAKQYAALESFLRFQLLGMFSIIKYGLAKRVDLKELIICPICRGELEMSETEIVCAECMATYPIVAGVPMFQRKPQL
jgi:hypothetical protein